MDIQPPSRETGIALPRNRRDDTAKDAIASEREQAGPTSAERVRRRHDDSEAGDAKTKARAARRSRCW